MSTVGDVLKRKGHEVASIDQNATVVEAARLMNARKIGALVVSDGHRVIGIFTERDVLNRVVAAGRDPAKSRVGDLMTAPVACCTSRTTVDECRSVMRERRIRHLPVVDGDQLSGMISIGDLNAATAVAQDETIRYMSEYLYGRT